MAIITHRTPLVLVRTKTYTLRTLCNQLGDRGEQIKRWDLISANGHAASALLTYGQAIEDVEPIGLDCAAALQLSKAGLVLLDHLREATPKALRATGLSAREVQLIQEWRGEDGTDNPSPIQILDDLIDLPNVGESALKKLKAAGLDSLEKLAAADAELLKSMRLGKALAPIEAWRAEQ